MYLHTRLLLGILAVTLFALLVSVLVPLASLRQDVSRETERLHAALEPAAGHRGGDPRQ